MKTLLVLLILFGCRGGTENSAADNRVQNIQSCLNLLRAKEGKNLRSLEHCQLTLVKDAANADLTNLYYGNNKLRLKKVNPADIRLYISEKDDTSKRYINIKYHLDDANHATIDMTLPNINWHVQFKITRADGVWQPKLSQLNIR